MNMMTKSGQTTNYKASDHVRDLVKYLGKQPDFVLINNGEIIPEILSSYERYNEFKECLTESERERVPNYLK